MASNINDWLVRWKATDEAGLAQVTPLVYSELRRLAAGYLRGERGAHTLQATALVHEAYLQVQALNHIEWRDRAHFIGTVANIMRRVLVDHARRRGAAKRGGAAPQLALDFELAPGKADPDLDSLDSALTRFELEYPRQARIVELKFFGGLTADEIVRVLDNSITTRTVERDWRFARAWLRKTMTGS